MKSSEINPIKSDSIEINCQGIYLNGARIPRFLQVEDELHKKGISYQMLSVIILYIVG